ncbi:Transcription factor bHLH25 [Linum grandiflorum]
MEEDPTWEGEYNYQIIQNPFGYPHEQDDFSLEQQMQMHDRCLMNGCNESNCVDMDTNTAVVDSIASLGISTENGAETHLFNSEPSRPRPPISSSDCMISFGNPPLVVPSPPATTSHKQQLYYYESGNDIGSVGGFDERRNRKPPNAQDHVIAERKRRQKLSQHFISLSALVPGLKKTDKASVLGEATKYMRHLQERVESLEKQTKTVEMIHYMNRCQVVCMEDASSSSSTDGENWEGRMMCSSNNNDVKTSSCSSTLPEIEARVLGEQVLIRIHCERQKAGSSCLAKVMAEIEKHHLTVVNTSVLPFGTSFLDITVLAHHHHHLQMEERDVSTRMRHLVKNLQRVVQ